MVHIRDLAFTGGLALAIVGTTQIIEYSRDISGSEYSTKVASIFAQKESSLDSLASQSTISLPGAERFTEYLRSKGNLSITELQENQPQIRSFEIALNDSIIGRYNLIHSYASGLWALNYQGVIPSFRYKNFDGEFSDKVILGFGPEDLPYETPIRLDGHTEIPFP